MGNVGNILRKRTVQFAWSVAEVLILMNPQLFKAEDSRVSLQKTCLLIIITNEFCKEITIPTLKALHCVLIE